MKTGIIVQARMGSARLPGKVMREFYDGRPMLGAQLTRLLKVRDHVPDVKIIVATSTESADNLIVDFARSRTACFRGSEDDVLGRFYDAARWFSLDTIVRITADCPLVDPAEVVCGIVTFEAGGLDYLSNAQPDRFTVHGFDIEVFSYDLLTRAHFMARSGTEREHVTPFMFAPSTGARVGAGVFASSVRWQDFTGLAPQRCQCPGGPHPNLSVDTLEDFELVKNIYAACVEKHGVGFSVQDVYNHLAGASVPVEAQG